MDEMQMKICILEKDAHTQYDLHLKYTCYSLNEDKTNNMIPNHVIRGMSPYFTLHSCKLHVFMKPSLLASRSKLFEVFRLPFFFRRYIRLHPDATALSNMHVSRIRTNGERYGVRNSKFK